MEVKNSLIAVDLTLLTAYALLHWWTGFTENKQAVVAGDAD